MGLNRKGRNNGQGQWQTRMGDSHYPVWAVEGEVDWQSLVWDSHRAEEFGEDEEEK